MGWTVRQGQDVTISSRPALGPTQSLTGSSGRVLKLVAHVHLMPRLRMTGIIPLLGRHVPCCAQELYRSSLSYSKLLLEGVDPACCCIWASERCTQSVGQLAQMSTALAFLPTSFGLPTMAAYAAFATCASYWAGPGCKLGAQPVVVLVSPSRSRGPVPEIASRSTPSGSCLFLY